ncbi:ACP phosphodiesterase [Biformimicrobium ophioploci]|uniref:ACP phosphodiesterase n=1 Tax=Biformimicrobium ophioploci TaxID=3036711 RepID=A0ABQ6LVS9_9GAMM|nr:ACP phosphodiesterase [Microbulbifer sp. NKW57]
MGGLLGDFVKGPLHGERPARIEAGIQLHRHLDAFTDQDPAYLQARSLVRPPWRRYAGILLDIWFDHQLSRSWADWSTQPLPQFSEDCLLVLRDHWQWLPPRCQLFCERAEQIGLLHRYGEAQILAQTLNRVGQRLSRPVPLDEALPQLEPVRAELERHFEALMQRLLQEAAQQQLIRGPAPYPPHGP